MSIEIFEDLEQNTPEWYAVRAGLPTASCFNVVRAKKGPRGGTSHKEYVGRTTYMRKLAGEILTGQPFDTYCGPDMERGKEREAEARKLYALLFGVKPKRIGFVKNSNFGGSPDSFIDDHPDGGRGGLEIKDAAPHIQIQRLEDRQIPPDDAQQCIGLLLASGRDWWDWMSHCRSLPPVILRIERDDSVMSEARVDVDQFVEELNELVNRIRSM